MMRHHTMIPPTIHWLMLYCCCLFLSNLLVSNALIPTTILQYATRVSSSQSSISSSTALHVFYSNNKEVSETNNNNVNVNGSADLFKTLELKDEALMQAQIAVSSLETALESAVTNLENLQSSLEVQVNNLSKELDTTKQELSTTKSELDITRAELLYAREQWAQAQVENNQLEVALEQSLKENENMAAVSSSSTSLRKETVSDNPWQIFSFDTKENVVPILNDWIAIKGTNEGEIQISGKVTNHPTIPDGDAIVTSPLQDAGKAAERKIVTTLSGSKYRLGTAMQMPASDSQSQKITSPKKKESGQQQLIKARSSISLPNLSGNTLGNGRYLLAGEATSSVNGRSYIQTAYRSSPMGKAVGEPLAIKFSSNNAAMKREYANYQKVSGALPNKRGSFIRRIEFLPNAGNELPDKSALVMQRGVADVKAFMPKVGGRLEGELLLDCALTAIRCVEALHSVRLVWNDLKTENFVVIEDQRGGVSFRAIDLESCMPVTSAPVDYTPEACPPEFARSFLDGDAESFSLEYSYDVWSYGMFLYEISTGRGFFDGISAQKITSTLPTFDPNVGKVEDPLLADLISQCLQQNPKDRLTIGQILKHPFLADATNGKNPFDFLFG